jgi:hypothetical protein
MPSELLVVCRTRARRGDSAKALRGMLATNASSRCPQPPHTCCRGLLCLLLNLIHARPMAGIYNQYQQSSCMHFSLATSAALAKVALIN